MFGPTKTFRRWHRRINLNQRRYAVASALAASAVPALVMARGHRIDRIAEVPLVIDNKTIDAVDKTKKALALLKAIGALRDVEKVKHSRRIRTGKGKMRNRRYVQRRGPLIVFKEKSPLVHAFRNLPGVELANVSRLNLLQLAPGGHLGRFIIWTREAFEHLDTVFGTTQAPSKLKHRFNLPRPMMTNPDFLRIVSSDEVQSHVRPARKVRHVIRKKNPLVNFGAMLKLNPFAATVKRRTLLAQEKRKKAAATKKTSPAIKKRVATVKKAIKARKAQTKKNQKALLAL